MAKIVQIKKINLPDVPGKFDDKAEDAINAVIAKINSVIRQVNLDDINIVNLKKSIATLITNLKTVRGLIPDIDVDKLKTILSDLKKQIESGTSEIKKQLESGKGQLDTLTIKYKKVLTDQLSSAKKQIEGAWKLGKKEIDAQVSSGIKKIAKAKSGIDDQISSGKKQIENSIAEAMKKLGDLNILDDLASVIDDYIKDKIKSFWIAITIIGVLILISIIFMGIIAMTAWKNRTMINQLSRQSQEAYTQGLVAQPKAVLEVAEQNPQTTQTVARAATAYGTGGASEIAGAVPQQAPATAPPATAQNWDVIL